MSEAPGHTSSYETWEVSAKGVFYPPARDKVLIMKYVNRGGYGLPGGHVDHNDLSIEQALFRELDEEMAGSSKELFYGLAAAPPVMHDDGDRIILPYSATYLGDTEKVQPRNPSQEIPLWVSVDDVDSYGLSGVYRALIARGRLV